MQVARSATLARALLSNAWFEIELTAPKTPEKEMEEREQTRFMLATRAYTDAWHKNTYSNMLSAQVSAKTNEGYFICASAPIEPVCFAGRLCESITSESHAFNLFWSYKYGCPDLKIKSVLFDWEHTSQSHTPHEAAFHFSARSSRLLVVGQQEYMER